MPYPQRKPTIPLGDGIVYTELLDAKFKGCSLFFYFTQTKSEETAAAAALVVDYLTSCSKQYPTLAALSLRKQALYGASIGCARQGAGDLQQLIIAANWLDDRFALDGASITDAMLELTLGCLLQPNAENGAFDAGIFRFCQQNLLDAIDCEINQKRSYAVHRGSEIAFAGEPAACPTYGSRESAEQLTAASAYQAWQTLLQTAQLEIVAVLPSEKPQLLPTLRQAFATLPRRPLMPCYEAASPCKAEPALVSEPMSVNQSKLVLLFKTPSDDRDSLQLCNLLLGGTTGSLLFTNVREKQSLCYYCASRYQHAKHTLMIDCGVRADTVEQAKAAILEQMETLRAGGFSEELMAEAVLHEEHALASASDSPGGLATWEFHQTAAARSGHSPRTREEALAALAAVTKEQVMAAAQSLQLDTVYILAADGTAEGEEATE